MCSLVRKIVKCFNSLLEMPAQSANSLAVGAFTFQFSIGDARGVELRQVAGQGERFQFSIGDAIQQNHCSSSYTSSVSILYWRCSKQHGPEWGRGPGVSILYWRCVRLQRSRSRRVDADVSILYWRCLSSSCRRRTGRSGSCFNSLLEMLNK